MITGGPARLAGPLLIGLLALAACSGPDGRQIRLCERIVPAIEGPGVTIDVLGGHAIRRGEPVVRVDYLVADPGRTGRRAHLVCGFGGRGSDRLWLESVATERGLLSPVQVFMLRTFWLERYAPRGAGPTPPPAGPGAVLGYGLQLLTNALVLASIYGLLAASFILVFALTRRINLAFGAMAVLGAYAAFAAIALAGGRLPLSLLVPMLVVAVVIYGGTVGLAFDRLLFRPLSRSDPQALLIGSLGVAILLEETLRLLQGAGERWVQPVLAGGWTLVRPGGFAVTVTPAQVGCVLIGLAALAGLHLLVHRTPFGRALRAAADDPDMAALCGVRTPVLRARALALSGALAALAGAVLLLRYGSIASYDGWLITFKGLTAAVVGGVGRIGGAALGALLIAAIETFWAGYLGSAWRDVATFAVLAGVLILRPAGLMADPDLPVRLQRQLP